MKLWIDDIRIAPHGYRWARSTNEATELIDLYELAYLATSKEHYKIEIIDIDHDAGDFSYDGGDYIKVFDWLENTSRNYPIKIHSMNPVGVQNMRTIIQNNGWIEVK